MPHLLQYVSNRNYYGRIKLNGKLIRASLETAVRTTACNGQFSPVAPVTGHWDELQTIDPGSNEIMPPGSLTVKVRSKDAASWNAINLRAVQLTPAD